MDRRLPPAVSDENVTATVKWFNATKGFGFIIPESGGRDIFIHASVIAETGNSELPEGATLVVDVMETARGKQVAKIHSVDMSSAQAPVSRGGGYAPSEPRDRGGSDMDDRDAPVGPPIDGTIKFFDSGKGYGFIVMDDGSRDVFISARTLERNGLMSVEPEQRVRVTTRMGQKGPMAESVELI
jgi:CspA family cold shock protein